eukprot:1161628-Pelagomonas_calceolata.AAC.3
MPHIMHRKQKGGRESWLVGCSHQQAKSTQSNKHMKQMTAMNTDSTAHASCAHASLSSCFLRMLSVRIAVVYFVCFLLMSSPLTPASCSGEKYAKQRVAAAAAAAATITVITGRGSQGCDVTSEKHADQMAANTDSTHRNQEKQIACK